MRDTMNQLLGPKDMFEGIKMSKKPVKEFHALLLSAALAMPTVRIQGGMSPARAEDSKNYIKISANAIGQTKAVNVGLNKSMVIDLPADAHDILVANPEVADLQ